MSNQTRHDGSFNTIAARLGIFTKLRTYHVEFTSEPTISIFEDFSKRIANLVQISATFELLVPVVTGVPVLIGHIENPPEDTAILTPVAISGPGTPGISMLRIDTNGDVYLIPIADLPAGTIIQARSLYFTKTLNSL